MTTLAFVRPWANGLVPYVINHPNARQDILAAIAQVERVTLIRFIERTTEPDYLDFVVADGNVVQNPDWKVPPDAEHPATSDVIGYCRGRTSVNLKENGGWLALHEIGHALGLMHEHQRGDRDGYVLLYCENVGCGDADFIKWDTSDDQGQSYDPESVMHYGATWQANGKTGMKWIGNPAEGIHKTNGWDRLTANDVRALNRLYLGEGGECADLIVYRKSTGYINSNVINGRGVGEIFGESWTTGYNVIEAFQMNGKPYCVCYKDGDGYLFVAHIYPNGYIDRIADSVQHWSTGYSLIKPFEMNGRCYCICYKRSGYLFTATISAGGYIDQIKDSTQDWTTGYTTIEPFKMNGRSYCICHKEDTGYLFVASISDNGYVDQIKASTQHWASGYIIKPFEMNGRPYCACYRSNEGSFFVATIADDGYIDRINSTVQEWTTGYTHMGIYYVGGRPYLTMYRGSSGYMIACSISDNLYVDQFWDDHWTEDYTSLTLVQRERSGDVDGAQ